MSRIIRDNRPAIGAVSNDFACQSEMENCRKKVNGRAATKNVTATYDCKSTIKPQILG
jgi:hypothetical protein